MPIVDIQKRMTEVGRIRMGEKKPTKGGGSRPSRLDHFRLTSNDRAKLEDAATVFGGVVKPWPDAPGGPQWQLEITADHLDFVVAPGDTFSQWYELWTGGGCERRCDGRTMVTAGGQPADQPCICPADTGERAAAAAEGEACKPTTRLSLWLPDLKGIGVWRLEAHGFYTAAELPPTIGFLQAAADAGHRVRASLRIDMRTVRRPGQPVKTFPVAQVDLPEVRLQALLNAGVAMPGEATRLEGSAAAQLAASGNVRQLPAGDVRQLGAVIDDEDAPPARAPERRPTRVPRPALGTRPDLPATSEFRRPQATAPTAPPPDPSSRAIPFPPQDTGDVAGEDSTLPFATSDTPAAVAVAHARIARAAPGPTADAAAAFLAEEDATGPLTPEAFRAMVRGTGAPDEWIVTAAGELFPDVSNFRTLTDEQRGTLFDRVAVRWAEAEKEAAAGVKP